MTKLALALIVLAACGNMTPSGDMTAVNTPAGGGLEGGSNVGSANLSLLTSCTDTQILKWNDVGGAWECASDATGGGGTGDIDGVTAGDGLTGGGTSGTVTLDLGCVTNSLVCNADSVGLASRDFGDITTGSSGTTMTIDNDAVTYAKIQNMAGPGFMARDDGTAGDVEYLTTGQATALLTQFNSATTSQGVVPGANGCGATCVLRADGTWSTETGDISNVTANSPLSGGGASGSISIGLSNGDWGDITTSGSTGVVWTIDNDVVTYAKMQNVSATSRIMCRKTAGAGDMEECTGGEAATIVGAISGTGTDNFFPLWNGTGALDSSTMSDNGATVTLASRALSVTGGAISTGYSISATTYIQSGSDGFYAGSSSDAYLDVQSGIGSLNFEFSVAGNAEGWINRVGASGGTTQFRDLRIGDGKGVSYVFFDGSSQLVSFAGAIATDGNATFGDAATDQVNVTGDLFANDTLQVSSTTTLNGNTTAGDADSDYFNSRATLAVSGTNVSTASANCTVAGEAQSFTLSRSSGGTASCVVDFNRTFNSAPYCVAVGAIDSKMLSTEFYVASSTTTSVTITSNDSIDVNVWCPDRR